MNLAKRAVLTVTLVGLCMIPQPARRRLPQLREGRMVRIPVSFEENRGQAPGEVAYIGRGGGATVLLKTSETVLRLPSAEIRTTLAGANPRSVPEAVDPLPSRSHYLLGNDPAAWQTNVPHYARVRYPQVYPGIDLIYHGDASRIEYDFVVAPGADHSRIEMRLDGISGAELTPSGDLSLEVAGGEILQHKPLIYQDTAEGRVTVAGKYRLNGGTGVGFQVGDYDPSLPLVIDPVLSFSSYLGGNGDETTDDIVADAEGNVYIAGRTLSNNFPVTSTFQELPAGSVDGYIVKLNPEADTILYATYFGGRGDDAITGIDLDAEGNLYLSGYTYSTDFPLEKAWQETVGGRRDGFLSKLSPDGTTLLYSSYMGGSDLDWAYGVAVDSEGAAYVVGFTSSTDFPTVSPFQAEAAGGQDVIVAKIAPDARVVYASYLGGEGTDSALRIAVDSDGSAVVGGYTASAGFPLVNALLPRLGGSADGFVARIHPSGGSLIFSTYWGGVAPEQINAVALAPDGDIVVAGFTASFNFPSLTDEGLPLGTDYDMFVSRIKGDASDLEFTTFIGGPSTDLAVDVQFDSNGNIFVIGAATSEEFLTFDPLQPASEDDVAVVALYPTGDIAWSTTYGSSGGDFGVAGTIVDDSLWITGDTDGDDLTLVEPLQAEIGNGLPVDDAFVARITGLAELFHDLPLQSAASGVAGPAARSSIVSAFGEGFTEELEVATTRILPRELGGLSVLVRDSSGLDWPAGLYFVSENQVNFVMPSVVTPGTAQVRLRRGRRALAVAPIEIQAVAPALFTANSMGTGAPAAIVARFPASGSPTTSPAYSCGAPGDCTTVPIQAEGEGEQVFLFLFGTGLRGRSSPAAIQVTIDGEAVETTDAVPQTQYSGMDQLNVRLGPQLVGKGAVPLQLTVDGQAANPVMVEFQ